MRAALRRLLYGGRKEHIHDVHPYDPRRLAHH